MKSDILGTPCMIVKMPRAQSAYSFSYGHQEEGVFKTIMSYATDPDIYLFSNPDLNCAGYPCAKFPPMMMRPQMCPELSGRRGHWYQATRENISRQMRLKV